MSLSAVSDITVERVVKKKTPKKHYVFSIQVEWKDGVVIRIYRSYDATLSLQQKLQKTEEFLSYLANEAAENRNGCLLQDKSLFGKVTVRTRKQATKKMTDVEEFLKSVVHLPSHISMSDVVIEFFRPVPDDMMFVENDSYSSKIKETRGSRRKGYPVHISEPILLDQYVAISDYIKTDKNDLNLKAGNIVEVIYKADHGWWFVDLDGDLGWVPASYLESRDGDMDEKVTEDFGDGEEEMYIAMGTYEPEFDDEIKLEVGKVVQVKQKKMDGWWLIKCDGSIGWVPCMHLRELCTSSTKAYAREMGREKAMMTMNNIFAITDRRITWNPALPPKRLSTFKSVRRHRFDKENKKQEEDEDKPPYINMEFHKKSEPKAVKYNNNNEKEAGPSYINLEFHKKENPRTTKNNVSNNNKEKEKGPSYINMDFHKKNEKIRQRVRRRRDDDEDMVEIDFDKMKELTSQSKEKPSKLSSLTDESQKQDESGKREAVFGSRREENKKESDSDSEDGYEYPSSFPSRQDTEKSLKTEELGQEPENITSKGTSLEEKPHNEEEEEEEKPNSGLEIQITIDESITMANGSNVFLAIGDYAKESDTEVNLQTGNSVQVLEQSEGGWWLVRTQSLSIGWAPSNFLEKISNEELRRRKELGLESLERPPMRPPKSPRVHRMALHVCTERRFWNFVRKNGPNNSTCSILDEYQSHLESDDDPQKLTVKDVHRNKLGENENHIHNCSKGINMVDNVCDPQTGVCRPKQNTQLKGSENHDLVQRKLKTFHF